MLVKKERKTSRGWLLLIVMFISFGFIEYIEAEKKYPVYQTDPQWGNKIDNMEAAKSLLIGSDFPMRIWKPIVDSLIAFQEEIRKQVIPQLPKQQPIKKDTIKIIEKPPR